MSASGGRPPLGVVIAAHNEEAVIGRCLRRLLAGAEPGEFDVVVVANGCTDRTAEVARDFPGVRVIELDQAGKAAALNAGDRASEVFPRLYLDADVLLGTADARALRAALVRSVWRSLRAGCSTPRGVPRWSAPTTRSTAGCPRSGAPSSAGARWRCPRRAGGLPGVPRVARR